MTKIYHWCTLASRYNWHITHGFSESWSLPLRSDLPTGNSTRRRCHLSFHQGYVLWNCVMTILQICQICQHFLPNFPNLSNSVNIKNPLNTSKFKFYFILESLKCILRTFWAQFDALDINKKDTFSKIWPIWANSFRKK